MMLCIERRKNVLSIYLSSIYAHVNQRSTTLPRHHVEMLSAVKAQHPLFADTRVRDRAGRAASMSLGRRPLGENTGLYLHAMRPHVEALCADRIDTGRPAGMDSRAEGVGCLRVHHGDPYLLLGPFKVQVLNVDPMVYVAVDVAGPGETEVFRLCFCGEIKILPKTPRGLEYRFLEPKHCKATFKATKSVN